jgi:hypothetical protein
VTPLRKYIWRVKLKGGAPCPASPKYFDHWFDVIAPNAEAATRRGRVLMRRTTGRKRCHVVSVRFRGEVDA